MLTTIALLTATIGLASALPADIANANPLEERQTCNAWYAAGLKDQCGSGVDFPVFAGESSAIYLSIT